MDDYNRLISHLQPLAPLAVAFSGGVDSSLLLKASHDAVGDQALAITIDSPLQFRQELADAALLASQIGVRQLVLPFDPDTVPGLMHNPPERCYLCKHALLSRCIAELSCRTLPPATPWTLLDGSTTDDLLAHRPGSRALKELGVRSPLQELGLDKATIRTLSRQHGLPTWNKPAQSCLMTRFAHGSPVSAADLRRVESCEEALHGLGFTVVRVRSLGTIARIEVHNEELAALTVPAVQEAVESLCKKAGFSRVMIDPAGYRSGSMD